MYYAKGLKDLIFEVELSVDFFESLDDFHIAYIDYCFKQALEDNLGLINQVGAYNLELFEEYKIKYLENIYFLEVPEDKKKKSAA